LQPVLKSPCFNSRAHAGRDCNFWNKHRSGRFQFTRPRGARLHATERCPPFRSFNSRAHAGRDPRRWA